MTFPQEFFATATKLDPYIVIDGTTYTHALKWEAANDDTILSGTVSSISGTTTKTIVCNRAFQTSSATVNDPTYGNFLKEVPVLMGGNIVARSEPWRLYNASNTGNAFRGSDSQKLEPGHCIEYDGKRFLITGVGTAAPATVAWQGTDPIVNGNKHTVKTTEFRLTFPDQQSVTLELKDDATDVYTDGGVAVEQTASPGTFTTLTRKIFNSDPDVYPDGAQIGADSYFYESGSGTVILGTGTESTGTNFFAFYFWRGLTETPTTGDTIILEGAGEYASTTDDVARVLRTCSADTDYTFFVFNKGSNSYGVGSCEFRLTTDDDSPVCVLSWDNTGFTGATQRTTAGGASSAVTLSATPTFNGSNDAFLLKVNRTTTTITVSYSENTTSPSYTTIATFTVSGLEALQTAYLGFSCPADEFIATGYLGATGVLYGDGVLATRQFVNLTISTLTMDVGLASTRPIDTITNLATGEEMTSSTTPARDHYTTVTDGIRLYNEAQGDKIRILHEVELSAPATPGYAARITNTVNLATQGSTTVSENLAHYHDTLTVADPDEELLITAGESFDGKLSVFSEEISDLEFDIFGDVTSDWTAMDAADYLSRDVGRWVLLAEDFTATHDVLAMCFSTNTPRMVANGSAFAGVYNDLATGLESLEDQWVRLTGASGSSVPIKASAFVGKPVPVWGCSGSDRIINEYILGQPKTTWADKFATLSSFGITAHPYYDIVSSVLLYIDEIGDTSHRTNATVNCGSTSYSTGDSGVYSGETRVELTATTTTTKFFGSSYFRDPLTASPIIEDASASFHFDGVPFVSVKQIAKLASLGVTCVEAKARIRMTDLEVDDYSLLVTREYGRDGSISGSDNNRIIEYINGEKTRDYEEVDGVVVTDTGVVAGATQTSYDIGFALMGRRRNSSNIYVPRVDEFRAVDGSIYKYYGAGVTAGGELTSDKWAVVDFTNAIKQALSFATSDEADLFLWPTVSGVDPDTSLDGISAYAKTLLPIRTVTSSVVDAGTLSVTDELEGFQATFTDIEIEDVTARFRLPSGAITNPVPIIRDSLI